MSLISEISVILLTDCDLCQCHSHKSGKELLMSIMKLENRSGLTLILTFNDLSCSILANLLSVTSISCSGGVEMSMWRQRAGGDDPSFLDSNRILQISRT